MNEKKLGQQFNQIISATKVCVEKELITPALILIYAGIDIAGWLNSEDINQGTKKSFTEWVNKYMFSQKKLPCDAIDLYAARCGLLHRLSPDSNLSEKCKARKIIYAWGTSSADDLQVVADRANLPGIAIHVNELLEAYQLGVLAFIEEISKDHLKATHVFEKANKCFVSI